jgi:chromosome segregation ATPase
MEQLQTNMADRRAKAAADYRQIVRRADNPLPGDANTLASALIVLQLDERHVNADIAAIREIRNTEAIRDRVQAQVDQMAHGTEAARQNLAEIKAQPAVSGSDHQRRHDAIATAESVVTSAGRALNAKRAEVATLNDQINQAKAASPRI